MRNLKALKVGGVQREEKKGKKMHLVSWKVFFSLLFFSLLLFICTSKMISKA
jgi:hypothetical protein